MTRSLSARTKLVPLFALGLLAIAALPAANRMAAAADDADANAGEAAAAEPATTTEPAADEQPGPGERIVAALGESPKEHIQMVVYDLEQMLDDGGDEA